MNLIKSLWKKIPRRKCFQFLFLALFLIIIYAPPLQNHIDRIYNGIDYYLQRAGIATESVTIEGTHYIKEEEIITCLNWEQDQSLFFYDLLLPTKCLEKHLWVKKVNLYKKYPSHLFVTIEEKKPFARYQYKRKLYVIEKNGAIIAKIKAKEFKEFITFVGLDSNMYASQILKSLSHFPKIEKITTSIVWVGKRRWDLHLKNAMLVKMPESHFNKGLERLATLNTLGSLLNRRIKGVDLRFPGKVIIDSPYKGKFEY